MRTQEEIVQRIEQVKERDMFGFEWQELMPFLDFEHARPYLVDGATAGAGGAGGTVKEGEGVVLAKRMLLLLSAPKEAKP